MFFLEAAFDYEAREATGFDGAFNRVASAADYGPALLAVVAVGLIGFGLFSLAQARYRELHGS